MAFKSTTITNLRVVGQFGIELYSRSEEKGVVKINALDWSDAKKIGKRLNQDLVTELDDYTYEVAVNKMKETSKIIEYIVSPNIIEIKNLPIFAVFSVEASESFVILQVKYQVSANWKNPLEDVSFTVFLSSSNHEVLEANSRGELQGNMLHWRLSKLLTSQKGVLEAKLKLSSCHIDHTKIQFQSSNSILSPVSGTLTFNSTTSAAVLKFLSEIVISNDN